MIEFMIFFKCVLLQLTFLDILDQTNGLITLPQVADNDILQTEAIIRSTANKLFSSLRLKAKYKTRLKQYSLIHNYFTSLTLKDYNNLKEIAKLTRVSHKNNDSDIAVFTSVINEILNEDSDAYEHHNNRSIKVEDNNVAYHIDDYFRQLGFLKHFYNENVPNVYINETIMNILKQYQQHKYNNTDVNYSDDDHVLDQNEFWDPSEAHMDTRRIYKGIRTRVKRFPFMAVVLMFDRFQCAGSIIKSDLVITAASCLQLAWNNRFFRENPAFLSVCVGADYYDGDGEVIPVLEVYFYPSYDPKTLRHNLAVMRLAKHVNFRRKKKVKKIQIDTEESPLPVTTDGITIVGWGAKSASNVIDGPWENKIHYARLDFYPLIECQEIYSKEFVTKKNFCAGFITTGVGACNKDVGGPGIVAGKLVGVVSFGSPECGTPDSPTVFTKVGFYSDWIEDIMEQEVPKTLKRTKPPREEFTFTQASETTEQNINSIILEETTISMTSTTPFSILRHGREDLNDFLKVIFESNELNNYLEALLREDEKTVVKESKKINEIHQNFQQDGHDFEKIKITLSNNKKKGHQTITTPRNKKLHITELYGSPEYNEGIINDKPPKKIILKNLDQQQKHLKESNEEKTKKHKTNTKQHEILQFGITSMDDNMYYTIGDPYNSNNKIRDGVTDTNTDAELAKLLEEGSNNYILDKEKSESGSESETLDIEDVDIISLIMGHSNDDKTSSTESFDHDLVISETLGHPSSFDTNLENHRNNVDNLAVLGNSKDLIGSHETTTEFQDLTLRQYKDPLLSDHMLVDILNYVMADNESNSSLV